MKRHIFLTAVILIIMVTLVSVQAFGQFRDKGIRVGIAGGFMCGLTTMSNDIVVAGRIFGRHNIIDNLDGDLTISGGGVKGSNSKYYQSDIYSGEYKALYKPYTFCDWEPYVGAGLGIVNSKTNQNFDRMGKSRSQYSGYIPIALGTEYTLAEGWLLDVNANLSYAFSSTLVSAKSQNSAGGNDAWWGISVGISYTIFGGGPSAAELEAARVKAEQEALHAKELAAAEAQRVQDSIKAAAEAAAREKEAKIAEARRLQEAAEAQRVQDSIKAAQQLEESKKEAVVPKPELPKPPEQPKPEQRMPEALKAEVGKAIVLDGVVFQSGKAVLLPESEQILSSAKKTLEDNPDIRVEIRGYTDNVGNAKKNLQLSQARAAAVKAWFVKNGIASTRITAKGYGDKNPIGDNKTAEGRTKNRRIEFFRTK